MGGGATIHMHIYRVWVWEWERETEIYVFMRVAIGVVRTKFVYIINKFFSMARGSWAGADKDPHRHIPLTWIKNS